MRLHEVERLCSEVVPGEGSIELENLGGAGLLSDTYRVSRGGISYSLKVAAADPPDLGLDLSWEVRLLERAAGAGLAARVVFYDLKRAVLLSRWVEGLAWDSTAAAAPANIASIAQLLRRVHALALPMPARAVTPMQWIKIYDAALSRRAAGSPDPALQNAALSHAHALLEMPGAVSVVCHSDLHAMNLIQANDSLILLDWEYAHVTDALWDLAGWCANNDFDADRQRALLIRYFGDAPDLRRWRRFRSLLAIYDYVCLQWSRLYLSVHRPTANGIAERARFLDARLRLPAHYAA